MKKNVVCASFGRATPLLLLALLCLLGQAAQAQTISLNGPWAFRTDPNELGEARGWFRAETSMAAWDSLPVPGNWDLRNEYAHYVGKGWYRRTFATPGGAADRVVRLLFEGVYHDCAVWLNGRRLGENHSGFLPFEFEVTGALNATGPNTLVVCADNSLTRGAIWNWGGIRRPVRLVVSAPVRVVRQHITPTVNLAARTGAVAVRVWVQNHGGAPAEATGTVRLSAPNGLVRSLPFQVRVPAGGTASVVVRTALVAGQTHLWHFDDPFLYTAHTALTNGSTQTNRFGLRKIEVNHTAYTLKLNGEVIRPMGFNLVPDDRTTGNTLPTWRIKEDIDMLKGMGCTMTRLAHMCLPEEMMDYLDERGMLVISEIPLWGFDPLADSASATPKDWLTRLVAEQYNHPSVVGWSVGNEIGYYPKVMPYVQSAIAHVRTLDSTRLVSSVSHTAHLPSDIVDLGDMGFLNKYSRNLGQVTAQQHRLHPSKTLFYTEYGGNQLAENLDADIEARRLLDSLRFRPYLVGASLWTFNDYRSHFHYTKELSENRPWGVVDVYRHKKRAYYSQRREHNPLRTFAVQPQGATSATIRLAPRGVLDLPAYPLHHYRLLWKRTDATGRIGQSGLVALPSIRPGDAPQTHALRWQPDSAFALTVELLAPTGDALADTTIFLRRPQPVRVRYAAGGRGSQGGSPAQIRLHFDRSPTATAYQARYHLPGAPAQETPPTLNDYIDIPKVDFDKTYQVTVVGINNAGPSEPGPPLEIRVNNLTLPPPIIQHVEPADGGFFVGYASPDDDYLYRVQTLPAPASGGNQPLNWAAAHTTHTTNPGTLFVPNLTNGQPYAVRFGRVKDTWLDSEWSEVRTVTPDGGQLPAVPVVQGVVRAARGGTGPAVVCFAPVAKATGYLLEYRAGPTGEWLSHPIATAQTGRVLLPGLKPRQPYQFRLAARNDAGQSAFSPILSSSRSALPQTASKPVENPKPTRFLSGR